MSDDSAARQVRRWRQKAEELRTEADQMKNPFARQSLVRMAETYEKLADDYESKAAGDTTPKPETG